MNKALIIFGATATGKTALADLLAEHIPLEIINMDSAQMYTACSIGTAKPNYQASRVPHHLFDIITEPSRMTAYHYAHEVKRLVGEIQSRGNLPVLVGGSGFYLKSLLFPPCDAPDGQEYHDDTTKTNDQLWQELAAHDPERADEIHPHDRYRVVRALAIWYATGKKPSLYKPVYAPLFPYRIVHVYKEKSMLHKAIDERISQMIQQGWVEETRALMGTKWQDFVTQKGFIGYSELMAYIQGSCSLQAALATISCQTKQYAKRQETFWRMVYAAIKTHDPQQAATVFHIDATDGINELDSNQLLTTITAL